MADISIIKDMLREEQERNLEMQAAFQEEIAQLPRGSLVVQNISGNDYCYLKHREGGRIVSQYMGRAEKCRERLESELAQRRRLEDALRRIKAELKIIRKTLGD